MLRLMLRRRRRRRPRTVTSLINNWISSHLQRLGEHGLGPQDYHQNRPRAAPSQSLLSERGFPTSRRKNLILRFRKSIEERFSSPICVYYLRVILITLTYSRCLESNSRRTYHDGLGQYTTSSTSKSLPRGWKKTSYGSYSIIRHSTAQYGIIRHSTAQYIIIHLNTARG